jgi:ketosteroid isomerase-like protein
VERETFEGWLDAYGRAWETGDPAAAAELFTEDAVYHETPFDEPMRGRAEISDYWSDVPRFQDDVRFSSEVVATSEREGVAHWRADFLRLPARIPVRLDGILLARLGAEGRCAEFREWWHRQEG